MNNGIVLSGAAEISEGFNAFFSSKGHQLAKNIPNSTKKFSDFLSEKTDENIVFANMTPVIINDALSKFKNYKKQLWSK